MHIQINISTKFQLKLTILIFRSKFTQKEYIYGLKQKNRTLVVTYYIKLFRTGLTGTTAF